MQRQPTDLPNPYGPRPVRSRSAGRTALRLIALGGAGAVGLQLIGTGAVPDQEPARYSSPFLSPYDDEEPADRGAGPPPEESPGSGESDLPGS